MNDTPSDDEEAARAKDAVRQSQAQYLKGLSLWDDVFRIVNRSLAGKGGGYLDKLSQVYDPRDDGGQQHG